MSTIELPSYVPTIPLPAPVTTGTTIQSYTDPYGDVWVAKNGVNGGAWARARDALHCRVYRNAAWTCTATTTQIAFDTVFQDNYGMFSSGSGIILPIAGIYRFSASVTVTATGAGQWLTFNVFVGAASVGAANNQSGQTTSNALQVLVSDLSGANAGALLKATASSMLSFTGGTGVGNTSLSASYIGTG
jgi:hypothetical protein